MYKLDKTEPFSASCDYFMSDTLPRRNKERLKKALGKE